MNLRWKIAQAVEQLWWKQYLKDKSKTDYLIWKQEYWNQFLSKTGLVLQPKSSVLDAGCGPAGIFMILSQQDVTAIDPLLNSYQATLAHFDPEDYPYTEFINSSLETYSGNKSFDYVFCLNAINHVANIELAMDRLMSTLRPGGKLVLSIDAHNHTWLKRIFQLLPGDILHPHQYDLEEYQQMVVNRGANIDHVFLQKKERIFNYYVIVATK